MFVFFPFLSQFALKHQCTEPLLELVSKDLKQGWTRFEEWDAAKQLAVILKLVRGKLIHGVALKERTGKKEDPLVACKNFS